MQRAADALTNGEFGRGLVLKPDRIEWCPVSLRIEREDRPPPFPLENTQNRLTQMN